MEPIALESAEDLEAAFHCFHLQIFRTIYARVGERQVAEDITQDAFMKAWEKRESYVPERASLRTWLFAIALNTMRDFFRTEKRRTTDELPEEIPDEEEGIAEELSQKAETEIIFAEMRSLPERDQELLTLRYVNDLPIAEVGKILQVTENAAKVAIHRAITKLKKRCNLKISIPSILSSDV